METRHAEATYLGGAGQHTCKDVSVAGGTVSLLQEEQGSEASS